MTSILVIDSSPRGDQSITRKITQFTAEQLQKQHPGAKITNRDLAAHPLPHLTGAHIAAYYTPAEQRNDGLKEIIRESDAAVAELQAHDLIVIGAPMWNFSIPSVLKSWIDHVVRAGVTFSYDANGAKGHVLGKKVIVVLATGGLYSQGPYAAMDFQTNYLKSLFAFIGMTDVTFIRAEGIGMGEEAVKKALASAEAQAQAATAKAA